jgi:quercetin dioxygenase-like cupin family protein
MKAIAGLLLFVFGSVFGAVVSSALAQQRPVDTSRLMKKDLEGCEGRKSSFRYSTLALEQVVINHYHPGESFTYILEGTQTREATGEVTTTLGPGGFIYDGPRQVHRTENKTLVKLLIVRVLDKGKPETIRTE